MKAWLAGVRTACRNLWQALGVPGDGRLEPLSPATPRRAAARWAEDLVWGVLWWLCLIAVLLASGSASRFIYVDF